MPWGPIRGGLRSALSVLDHHAALWESKAQTREALSRRVLAECPQLQDPAAKRAGIGLSDGLAMLGQTHDPKMIQVAVPLLTNKTATHSFEGDAMLSPDVKVAPERLCDDAYNAICALHGKPAETINFRYWGMRAKTKDVTPEQEPSRRDALIEKLARP